MSLGVTRAILYKDTNPVGCGQLYCVSMLYGEENKVCNMIKHNFHKSHGWHRGKKNAYIHPDTNTSASDRMTSFSVFPFQENDRSHDGTNEMCS